MKRSNKYLIPILVISLFACVLGTAFNLLLLTIFSFSDSMNDGPNMIECANGEMRDASQCDECSTNTDCNVTQECRRGECVNHQSCENTSFSKTPHNITLTSDDRCPSGYVASYIRGVKYVCLKNCNEGCENGTCNQGICVEDICSPTSPKESSFVQHHSFRADSYCSASWSSCDDGKKYDIECYDELCICNLNGTKLNSFYPKNCEEETIHRIANIGCGFELPEIP